MNVLSRKAILGANDLPSEKVNVPEWGGEVYVRSMNAMERELYEQSIAIGEGDDRKLDFGHLRTRLLLFTVTDDQGKRLFEEGDVEALASKSARAINRIAEVAQRLNGIGVEALDAAKKP